MACCEGKLSGKVALVTGGARGIGKAICERLAEEGAALAIVDIMLETAEETAKEFQDKGVQAIALAANVAKPEDAAETVKAVMDQFGKVDILINNAGITRDGLMVRMSEQDWDMVIDVNLKGVFNFTKACMRPMMKAKYGKIVNIASVVGRMGNAGQGNYSASKAGVIGLTKTTARELATRNVTCNAVAPGFIITDMTHAMTDTAQEAMLGSVPMNRGGSAKEVADVVNFLSCDDSSYVTGQTISIDGGMFM